MSKYTQLSLDERILLSFYKEQGRLQNEIARLMKRSESTISRELKRNSNQNGYVAATAHKRSLARCAQISRIDQHPLLAKFIIERLQENWTPEQVSGRLKTFPEADIPYVNHESIYQWLYQPTQKKRNLHKLLPQAHNKSCCVIVNRVIEEVEDAKSRESLKGQKANVSLDRSGS